MMHLFADFHTHTKYSHGKGTVFDNVRAAQVKGLETVAISDHGPANWFGVGVANLGVFADIRADIERATAKIPGVQVLLGVEANVIARDGRLDIPRDMQDQFDIVLAGLHTMVRPFSWLEYSRVAAANASARWNEENERAALILNTDLLVAAVHNNSIDIVTHPGYRLPIDTYELAKACAATKTAMEINTSHPYTTIEYVKLVRKAGATLVVGSDAHRPERVGDFASGLEMIAQAGVPPEQVLNASPVTV